MANMLGWSGKLRAYDPIPRGKIIEFWDRKLYEPFPRLTAAKRVTIPFRSFSFGRCAFYRGSVVTDTWRMLCDQETKLMMEFCKIRRAGGRKRADGLVRYSVKSRSGASTGIFTSKEEAAYEQFRMYGTQWRNVFDTKFNRRPPMPSLRWEPAQITVSP